MSKKLAILLSIFMVSVLAISGCKKDAKKGDTKDTKKEVTKKVDGKKKVTKKTTKKATKSAAKLDLSYFPEAAVVVGSVDINKFLSIKVLKPLLDEGLKQVKAMGIDIDKAQFASYYMNLDSLKKADDVAVLVNGLTVPEALLTKMGLKFKKETHNGVELLVEPNDQGGFATMGNDTLAGSLKSIKKMIDVKKGKAKSLATTKSADAFKAILAKTGKSAFKIAFVPNALVMAELTKASKEDDAAMFAELMVNFKAASFGIEVTEKDFIFSINLQSSKKAIDALATMGKSQLGMLQQDNSPMLAMAEPMLGKEGVSILSAVVKTIKLTTDGEFMSVTFSTKLEYWLKAPKIFGEAMGKMGLK